MTKTSNQSAIESVFLKMMLTATQNRVSDIHIEPQRENLIIRFRIDGILIKYDTFPLEILPLISGYIKVKSQIDITEKRRHQGGRFAFKYQDKSYDLRVSIFATVHGEKIVLRLLNREDQKPRSLKEMGMGPKTLRLFNEYALKRPSGVIIVTGPTGSGKTTTVYSCIQHLNQPDISIITAEDPVEAIIDGTSQCSINPKINLTFDETLRHIVRQDPDIIFIGEIRDKFSAETAVQSALTGHKVLTTFHSEDSIGALIRLVQMGIEPFMVSSTISCIIAQRLLRKICPKCAVNIEASPKDIQRIGYAPNQNFNLNLLKGQGCQECRNSGYSGRIPIFEVLIINEHIRSAILRHATAYELRKIAIENGNFLTLFEDGIAQALNGKTTVDEVLRCLPKIMKPRSPAQIIEMRN